MLSIDKLFMIAAGVGGVLFVVQLLLMLVGGGVDADVDAHGPSASDVIHDPSNVGFKALSLQGITAFVMMFGLVGWAMRADSQAGPLSALVVALLAGIVSLWSVSKLFAFFGRLQSDGTLNINQAVGAEGEVYLTVAADKPGKVSITVDERAMTLEAITEGEETLVTGTPIRVIRVISDTTVVVVRS